ncbi:phosphate ABC transporter substrate-binding protein [Thermogemmatispora carboxidivorans]|uniref:phosphate ABC transporter substrate-binding protein n=1 Tax=Thermogemmatispora carboxidivorans TaxID=1382306 RepID=UPI00069B3E18|nr:phosphate ABC transporter substrate-binding protein [Thermogemmatispora carboxidivorans]
MVNRKRRRGISAVLIGFGLIVLILLAGCGEGADSQSALSGRLHIAGSTALQPLVSTAAGLFERQHPQAHIQVDGGGSRAGLAAVTSHQADIGDSDIYADPAIYPDPNLTDHIVCVIPFAMVANPDVTVTSLTRQQIIDIFSTGRISNWSQVGGPDLPIVPVVRPQTSGTRDTFRKYILGGRDEKGKLLQTDSSVTVRETVAHTPGAIGYLALSVLTPAVRVLAIEGARPTLADIVAGRYIFWSYEHMYTLGDDNPLLSAFLDFMLSEPVQQKAQEMGYIPIAAMNLKGSSGKGASALSLAVVTGPAQERAFAFSRRKEE